MKLVIVKLASVFLILSLVGCSSTTTDRSAGAQVPETTAEMLSSSYQLLENKQTTYALAKLLKAEKQCNEKYDNIDSKVYVARSPDERFFYLLQASFEEVASSVEKSPCADIHYLLGYTYLEINNIDKAYEQVTKALTFSPVNAAYLSELGHIHQLKGDFQKALTTYKQAEENAEAFSPASLKKEELSRAKRGIGYSLIELGQLEQAEAKFNEALQISPDDRKAKSELEYIKSLEN